jgi:hypothetical protein
VFKHWGRTSGHGADGAGGAGLEDEAGTTGEELELTGLPGVEDDGTGTELEEEQSGPPV